MSAAASCFRIFLVQRKKRGLRNNPFPHSHEVRSLHEIWALVARGLIVHPTVASTAQLLHRDDIVLVPITGLPPMPLGLIWCSIHENARIRALAAAARAIYPPG